MYLCLGRVPAINHEPRKQASTNMYRSSRRVDMSQASVKFFLRPPPLPQKHQYGGGGGGRQQ